MREVEQSATSTCGARPDRLAGGSSAVTEDNTVTGGD